MLSKFQIVLIYLFSFHFVYLQRIPQNPCPRVFQYINMRGEVIGRLEFPNDNSGTYILSVNVTVATYIGQNQKLRLELETPPNNIVKGAPLVYYVHFPSTRFIPKPTEVIFNKKLYCSSSPEEVRPGGYVTNLWANTFFKITYTHGSNEVPRFPFEDYDVPINKDNSESSLIFEPWEQTNTPTEDVWNRPDLKPLVYPIQPWDENIIKVPSTTKSSTSLPNSFIFVPWEQTPFTTEAVTRLPVARPPPVDFSECGKPSIITMHSTTNGEEVEEGQFPWMTAVMYKSEEMYVYRCTGTLVSSRHVITAGHCLQYGKAPLFPVEDVIVVLGTVNLENGGDSGVKYNVLEIKTHPNYVQDSADNDVSVLKLSNQVYFNKNIRPVCLWEDKSNDLQEIVGKEGTVAGWGSDQPHAKNSPKAKRSNLPIVSHNDCLQSDVRFHSITSVRTFCAGKRDDTGPCIGDSGAGLVMFKSGHWLLRGVISIPLSNSNACDLENYFVFADLAQVKGWLKTVLV